MDRKTFLKKTTGALLLATTAYALSSCSSSSDDSGSNNNNGGTRNCLDNGTASTIGGNHGHSLTVSKGDVANGTEKTYTIDGSAGHSHMVTVTAANFSTLQGNQQVAVSSTSGNGHSHSVTISCA